MILLKAYDSDEFSSEENNEDIVQSQDGKIDSRTIRQVYLITYSRAYQARFPTRESFVQAVLLLLPGKSRSNRYPLCMVVKLNKNQTCLQSKKSLLEKFGISVHFFHHSRELQQCNCK